MKKVFVLTTCLILLLGLVGVVFANSQENWHYYKEYNGVLTNCENYGYGNFEILWRVEWDAIRIYFYNNDGLVYKTQNKANGHHVIYSSMNPEKVLTGNSTWNWFWLCETPGEIIPATLVKMTGSDPNIQVSGEGNFNHVAGMMIIEDPDRNPEVLKVVGIWFENMDRICQYFAEE